MSLTEKQKRFCNEYIIDFNATQAAIRAGYSKKTAYSIGQKLLKKVEIQEKLSKLMADRSKRTEITQDRVLLEIARLAFNDARKAFDDNGNLLPIQEWPDDVAAAISSIKVTEIIDKNKNDEDEIETYLKEIKFWDKGKQIELAAKHLNMLKENMNVNLSGEVDNHWTVEFINATHTD